MLYRSRNSGAIVATSIIIAKGTERTYEAEEALCTNFEATKQIRETLPGGRNFPRFPPFKNINCIHSALSEATRVRRPVDFVASLSLSPGGKNPPGEKEERRRRRKTREENQPKEKGDEM